MMMRRVLSILTALMVLVLASCGAGGEDEPMTLRSDKELSDKVLQIKVHGGSAPLATLTTFEWDTVFAYQQGATADEINGDVGDTVIEAGGRFTNSATLAVFLKDGKVVKALLLPELTFTRGRQPAGVVLDGNQLRTPG